MQVSLTYSQIKIQWEREREQYNAAWKEIVRLGQVVEAERGNIVRRTNPEFVALKRLHLPKFPPFPHVTRSYLPKMRAERTTRANTRRLEVEAKQVGQYRRKEELFENACQKIKH